MRSVTATFAWLPVICVWTLHENFIRNLENFFKTFVFPSPATTRPNLLLKRRLKRLLRCLVASPTSFRKWRIPNHSNPSSKALEELMKVLKQKCPLPVPDQFRASTIWPAPLLEVQFMKKNQFRKRSRCFYFLISNTITFLSTFIRRNSLIWLFIHSIFHTEHLKMCLNEIMFYRQLYLLY